MTLFTLAILGAIVTIVVLQPAFKKGARSTAGVPAPGSTSELGQLAEHKERLLTTLKDLEFEHNAGKLSDADYERVRAEDVAQLAKIMTRMDQLTGQKAASKTRHKRKKTADTRLKCSACQQENPPEAKFCLDCGTRLKRSVECSKCGKTLPAKAKFCIDCGARIGT